MSSSHYKPQARNAQAVNVTRSWLAAVGIESATSAKTGCDLVIKTVAGEKLHISIVNSLEDPLPEGDCLILLSSEIGSYRPQTALNAFHIITEVAGYGKPCPVDRGVAPTHKDIYGQDLFLTACRHTEFRTAPDLSPALVTEYKKTVTSTSRAFFSRNTRLCRLQGYETEDLETFAWVWAHIYAHRYVVAKPTQKHGDDNQRLLTRYIQQRFLELRTGMAARVRNSSPAIDVVQIALMGRILSDSEKAESYSIWVSVPAPVDFEPLEQKKKVDPADRKQKNAAKLLKANLEALPHDVRVARLKEMAESDIRDYATKKEARKQLTAHFQECGHCQEAGVSLQPMSGGESKPIVMRRQKATAGSDDRSGVEDEQYLVC